MRFNVNVNLIMLYKDSKKDIDYSLTQLINSIPNEFSNKILYTLNEFSLNGEDIDLEIDDTLVNVIIEKFGCGKDINRTINLLIWIAYLFPEI